MRRSIGRSTGSRNVRSRLNTRVIYTPSGLVTSKIASRNTAICSQPFRVISELFRTQKGVKQIRHGQYGDGEHDDGLGMHLVPHLTRSQNSTYPIESRKKAIVVAMRTMSRIRDFLSRSI